MVANIFEASEKIFMFFKIMNLMPFTITVKNNSFKYCYKKSIRDKYYFIILFILINSLFIYCLKNTESIDFSPIMNIFRNLLKLLNFLSININYIFCYYSSKIFFNILVKIYNIENNLNQFLILKKNNICLKIMLLRYLSTFFIFFYEVNYHFEIIYESICFLLVALTENLVEHVIFFFLISIEQNFKYLNNIKINDLNNNLQIIFDTFENLIAVTNIFTRTINIFNLLKLINTFANTIYASNFIKHYYVTFGSNSFYISLTVWCISYILGVFILFGYFDSLHNQVSD